MSAPTPGRRPATQNPNGSPAASAGSGGASDVSPTSEVLRALSTWLADSKLGLAVMALVVGAAAGVGAAFFRWLIFSVTWVATGYQQFGQQGRVASLHFPFLGIWFVLRGPGARAASSTGR